MEINIYIFILSLVSGIAGGLITIGFNTRKSKTDLALKIIKKIGNDMEDIQEVYSILSSDEHNDAGFILGHEGRVILEKFAKVVKVGDYFDLVAYLYLSCKVNRGMLEESSIIKFVNTFISLLRNFKNSEYNISSGEYDRLEWAETWPHLAFLKTKNKYIGHYIRMVFFG